MNRFVSRAFCAVLAVASVSGSAEEWVLSEGATASFGEDYLKFITYSISEDDEVAEHVVRENSDKTWPLKKSCYYLISPTARIAKLKAYLLGGVERNPWDGRASVWAYVGKEKELAGMFIGRSDSNNGLFRLFNATITPPARKKDKATAVLNEVALATYDHETRTVTFTGTDGTTPMGTAVLSTEPSDHWDVEILDDEGDDAIDDRLVKLFLGYIADNSVQL